jgi:hypothetical protein
MAEKFTVAELIQALSMLHSESLVVLEECDCVEYWNGQIGNQTRDVDGRPINPGAEVLLKRRM